MTITKTKFKGGDEERQRFQPAGQFGGNEGAEATIEGMVGAAAMQSKEAKGLTGPGENSPRRAGASQAVAPGNSASTGAQGAPPSSHPVTKGANPTETGAGRGKRTIKTYGPGGGESGVGGI